MSSSRLGQRVRRYRAAWRQGLSLGRDPDEWAESCEQSYRRELLRSLEHSSSLDPERERVLDALAGGLSRRSFIQRGILAGLALTGTGSLRSESLVRRSSASASSRIVVVGAGFAGLAAAYELKQRKGWDADVYEASGRVGGRARTIRGLVGGKYTEAGPSGISSSESVIQNLCQDLGLWPLVDTWKHYANGDEVYRFNGESYSWEQIKAGINAIGNAGWKAWKEVGSRIPTYDRHNAAAVSYDGMSVTEFLQAKTDFGPDTPAGAFTVMNFGAEYGPAASASALHQILEEGNIWGGGGFDERYAVPGGNDTLASALAARLAGKKLHLDHALVALRESKNGTLRLTFDNGSLVDVVADRVILAIPPTTLRDVDLRRAGFSKVKLREIQSESLAPHVKLNIQFRNQPWAASGHSGDAVSDLTAQLTWAASYQGVKGSVLVAMNHRDYGNTEAHGLAGHGDQAQALADVDTLFPGSSGNAIAGQAYLDNWRMDPWARGSYAYNRPGDFIAFEGIQAEPEGNVFFAGEHTASYIHSGYMNGAVESGQRAAREVVDS
jgi:monoamine oxidase